LHSNKLDLLCSTEFKKLADYLLETRLNCPKEYFLEGPRSSSLRFQVPVDVTKMDHEVSLLARMGLDSEYYDNAHMNVQMFMLSFDNKTIGIEIPLWLTKDEFVGFEELFKTNLALSGHIDLIRIENNKIWIWDYKPKSCKEKYATTQTYFYALMLSIRTGLPLDKFMCGYFDDIDCYVFDPSKVNPAHLKI